ncbi:hypothetical protein ACIROD_15595 [Peribacillus sp. NPDC101481]|uniref:hypothetical protein n=1 Tax=Peribacillus TaxID=2675229 RepID=UPI001D3B72F7|nr:MULTISPECIES: hypothetical protein [Peribacillus]MCT4477020.1 hypothetical protein [Peribacillus frigoritolerans]CAH0295466.1 hypothetical protein SRABI134_04461 [Peribacillus sp. Bi134]
MFNKSTNKKLNSTTPIICKINDVTYQKYHLYKKSYEREVLVIKDYGKDRGVTNKSIALFEAVKDQFDRFKIAKIVKEINNENFLVDSDLILIDKKGNELHLSGCSCGYAGTGSHGTVEILNKAGFEIDRRFVICSKGFTLFHPNEEKELYGERL